MPVAALGTWWPVCLAEELRHDQPVAANCGPYALALFRDKSGHVRAVENRCPHRRVPLSMGRVSPEGWIQCAYHGWAFDGQSIAEVQFAGDEMTVERSAAGAGPTGFGPGPRDHFIADYPLVLHTRTNAITGFTILSLRTSDNQPVLQAAISSTPDARGVTAVRWRCRAIAARAHGFKAWLYRAWMQLGRQPLAIRDSIDGAQLARAIVGPSHDWRAFLLVRSERATAVQP